ncbi:MAG: hypothetical protein J0H55_16875 [Chitinophagaceae bacterium]|nr:hypothetical protein [Chitinophagaceae bacterium]
MQLTEVEGKKLSHDFLLMPYKIYKTDPNYIRPLDKDVENVFDPAKNRAFRFGTCKRWLLENDDGEYIGRIAAFVNAKYKNKGDEQKTGGIGFFECINDQSAADMLFDVSKSWLAEKGMEAMDGPVNFGERDRFWGLVIEGFMPPIYLMNYNPPYYQKLFEDYGFKIFFNQMCFAMSVDTVLSEKFSAMHEKFKKQPEFSARYIRKSEMRKFAHDFVTVYNAAWAKHEGNKNMTEESAMKMFGAMKPVIDERLVWFAYHNGEPVACWLNLPELNQIFKHFNGRLRLIEKLRFILMQRRGVIKKFTGIVFGVVPEFQGTGVDYFMIKEAANLIQYHTEYKEFEMQWQGDFNPKMLNISQNLGAHLSRKLATYRFLFDRTKEFKRHPILG